MKKQELVHLHGLLAEVKNHYEEWGKDPDLEVYDNLGVKPSSIHMSKDDHKEAVFALAYSLNGSGNTDERLEDLSSENPVSWRSAWRKLEDRAEPVESEIGQASLELTEDLLEELGERPYSVLEDLDDRGFITTGIDERPSPINLEIGEDYDIGTTVYLKSPYGV